MLKKAIAVFFITLYMSLNVLTLVCVVLDNAVDASMFYSLAEEEETGKTKKSVSPFYLNTNDILTSFNLKSQQLFSFQFKKYTKPHLSLIFSPPDHVI